MTPKAMVCSCATMCFILLAYFMPKIFLIKFICFIVFLGLIGCSAGVIAGVAAWVAVSLIDKIEEYF